MAEYRQLRRKSILQKLWLLLLFLCLAAVSIYLRRQETRSLATILEYTNGNAITCSLQSGFYEEAAEAELVMNRELPSGARIRYTVNGDDPSGKSAVYAEPITFEVPDSGEKVVPLKARIFYQDEVSDVYSWTFVMGKDIFNRYQLPVISITSNFKGLYSYETGILADGISKDMARVMGRSAYSVGNYFQRGEEWVRPSRVTVFSSDGKKLMEQSAGLAVSGGSSRARKVKSFKITAGEPYGDEGEKFHLDLFSDSESDLLSYVNDFTNLKLRTADVRNRSFSAELAEQLARDSGFDGFQFSRPAILFLNGEFYSIVDLQPSWSASYIAHRFCLTSAKLVEKVKKVEDAVFEAFGVQDLFLADLTEKENRDALEAKVDMDNYLLYYAIQVLTNNTDWPGNNFEAWRYTGHEVKDNKYTDGRIRFLIYDADFIYSRSYVPDNERGLDVFVNLMENEYFGSVSGFANVMRAKEYRDRFVTIVTDLLSDTLGSENVRAAMEKIFIGKRDEFRIRFGEENDEAILRYIQNAEQIADGRASEMADNFSEYFGLEDQYTLKLEAEEGVSVNWNQMRLEGGNSRSTKYLKDVSIEFHAETSPGYRFRYWLLNGEKVKGSSVTVDGSSLKKGRCTLKAVSSRLEGPLLLVDEISAKSDADWIRLRNAGTEDIELSGYYLSDSVRNPTKYRLPEHVLSPGESVIINGQSNYYAVGEFICNFNLNRRESLIITDAETEESVSIRIPRMCKEETWGRESGTNRFVFYNNLNEIRKKTI